ncbi:retropepsin-like aspartic protease [Maribacter antarcticus]|uniref:retropepsin-like aspartic protease n=1 Tax=Maribacter antarcticus TaxID=505250 RepID=UPI00047DBD38|nr:retropepsin-like aspartic protease [Maribacter antarcticus]
MKSGEVEQEEFNVKIPFEYRLGLIILKVNISGEEYDFILDTGAPNAISKELAKKLELSNIFKQKVVDSQSEESKLGFVLIKKLGLGGIDFLNMGAAVADLKQSKEVGCLRIDGFIGSNLMRKAIWKFDYQNQIITITNSIESLSIPKVTSKIPFFTMLTGTPIIDFRLNDVTQKNVIVDLGSNGGISLSKKTYNALMKNNPSIPQTSSFGISGSGLYGLGKADSTYHIKAPSVSFGDVSLENTIVSFADEAASTIGNQFFKNYDFVLNWFTKEILLINKTEYDNSTLATFGFSCSNQENHLIVSNIYKNMEDLKIGDQILQVGKTNYNKLLPEQWCEILENGLTKEKEVLKISILRDNKKLSFTLRKEKLL